MIITIDGPTASGKSTVAAMLAQRLGFYHLNTGLLYRSLAYILVTEQGYSENDLKQIKQEDIAECIRPDFFTYQYNQAKDVAITYKGRIITHFLKDASVDRYVTLISSQKLVRHAMVALQRDLAQQYNLVVDGRDVGSHVFPQAAYKFYLTASLEVRTVRWQKDQKARGNDFTFEEAQALIIERDRRDQEREVGPLIIPQGGIMIDNSTMTLDETVALFLSYIIKPCC